MAKPREQITRTFAIALAATAMWLLSQSAAEAEAEQSEDKKEIVFSGFDALAHVEEKINLRAKIETSHIRRDIEDEQMDFYVAGVHVGSAKTDDEGFASLSFTPDTLGNFEIVYR